MKKEPIRKRNNILEARIAIVNAYTLIALLYCAFSSILFYSVAENIFLAVLHLLAFLSVVLNYLILNRTGNFNRATNIILATGSTVVVSLFGSGGWANTGYLWPFAYLPFAFFLSDRKAIVKWVAVIFGGCLLVVVLHFFGVITVPYSSPALVNYFAALSIFTVCIFLFQKATVKREEFLSYTDTLLEAAPDAVIVIDEAGKIFRWNNKSFALFGWTSDEVMGKLLSEVVIPLRYRSAHTNGLKHFLKTEEGAVPGKTIEIQAINKNNIEFDVALSISPTLVNDKSLFIGFFRDITEQKKAEDALESANKELEAFSYSVSHDLRAPLRAINGYAQMLDEDYSKLLGDEGRRLLATVQGNARKMGTLIDDLLAFSRMGKKAMNKSMINMTALAETTLSDLNKSTDFKTRIKINPLLPVMADNALMCQVWINLISNAIKYSSHADKPVVEINSERINGEVIYSVSDNGAGFDMQYAHKLFGVFQRLHGSEEFEGTGVGLALVNRIVVKHGGKVWAKGEIGKGATFYFSLPAAPSLAPQWSEVGQVGIPA